MNLVIFTREENHRGRVILRGRRAEHICRVLKKEKGDQLRVGELNGRLGTGIVMSADTEQVVIQVQLDRDPPAVMPLELILALPRPIMLERILKQATVMGVERLHLIRARRVEKSYFHSPALGPERVRKRLIEGLEQAGDTRLPQVLIHDRFKPFVEDVVPTLNGTGLLAHPDTPATLPALADRVARSDRILLAVGPEGGWSDYECAAFAGQGFTAFSLGQRILHVDTAVVALMAQIAVVRNLAAGQRSGKRKKHAPAKGKWRDRKKAG